MAKRCLLLFTVFSLVLALLVVGTSQPAQAQKHKTVNLKLYAMSIGGSVYVLTFALAEIINKNHPWLRVECLEGRGSTANLKMFAENPDLRKHAFFFTNEPSNLEAREGKKPFTAPYTGARAIAAMTATSLVLATLDKNTKTKEDFVGKRFMTMRPGTSTAVLHETLLKDVWGA